MDNVVIAHLCSLDLTNPTELKNNKSYTYVEKCLQVLKWFDSKTQETCQDLYGMFKVVIAENRQDCEKIIVTQLQEYLGVQGLDALDFEFKYKYSVTKDNQSWLPLTIQSSWKKCNTYLGETK